MRLASILAGSVALGQVHAQHAQEQATAAAQQFLGGQVEIVDTTAGPMDWTALRLREPGGAEIVAYVDPGHRYLMTGAILDMQSGENITAALFQPKPRNLALFDELASAAYIETGEPVEGATPAYVIVDARCRYCHLLVEQVMRNVPHAWIRWIPVAFMGATSQWHAADWVGASDPEAGRQRFLAAMTDTPQEVDEEAVKRGILMVEYNTNLAEKLGVRGTPTTLTDRAGTVHKIAGTGVVKELAQWYASSQQP